MMYWFGPSTLLVALIIDVCFAEPANRFHPVAWMGNLIQLLRRCVWAKSSSGRFLAGLMIVLIGGVFVGSIALMIEGLLLRLAPMSMIGVVMARGLALKTCFAVRSLSHAASLVHQALCSDDLESSRREVAYHLVSRDTSQLDASGVAAATIESVAENTCDSFVAPLFYFAIGGLTGAAVYRYVNTCDAMIGYRTAELEWLGKPAARLDDVLNWVPSRLTAALMIIAAPIAGLSSRGAMRIWKRDRWKTASPNAGQSISVAAGALGVQLEKIDHYCINADAIPPKVDSISRMLRLYRVTIVLVALFCAVAIACWSIWVNTQ